MNKISSEIYYLVFSLSHQLNLITIMFPPTRLLDCRGEIWSLSQKFCKVFINIIIQTKSTYHIYYYILQGVHPYIHSDENNIFLLKTRRKLQQC